jgi:hypothetical protein
LWRVQIVVLIITQPSPASCHSTLHQPISLRSILIPSFHLCLVLRGSALFPSGFPTITHADIVTLIFYVIPPPRLRHLPQQETSPLKLFEKKSWSGTCYQVVTAAVMSLWFTNHCSDKWCSKDLMRWKSEGVKLGLCGMLQHLPPYCQNHCWVCWAVCGVILLWSVVTATHLAWSLLTYSVPHFSKCAAVDCTGCLTPSAGCLALPRRLLPHVFVNDSVLNLLFVGVEEVRGMRVDVVSAAIVCYGIYTCVTDVLLTYEQCIIANIHCLLIN